MADKNVKINDCKFDKPEVKVIRGNNIFFESTDKKEYTVSCGRSNSGLSKDLPLTVTADGSQAKLHINKKADKKNYDCEIIEGCPEVRQNTPRPKMIINVE